MRNKFSHKDAGQVLVWFALSMAVFFLFAALAVDFGLIYLTKARLANGVDSAVLTAVKNYPQGTTTASSLGADMFVANYGSNAPVLTWTWCAGNVSCGGAISASLNAETSVHTRFMSYLPQWSSVNVGDTAAATRSNLVMMIVLDRSGSMCGGTGANKCTGSTKGDDGGDALQAAVPLFVDDFDEGQDYVGEISFASHSSIDVSITQTFQSAIRSAVGAMKFTGGTFGTAVGSGTNYGTGSLASNGPPMSMADTQLNSVSFGSGVPEVKVMVYFTDGLMNTLQDQFTCGTGSGTPTVLNYGGADPDSVGESSPYAPEAVYSLNPAAEISGTYYCYDISSDPDYSKSYSNCNTTQLPKYDNSNVCTYNGTKAVFPSEYYGGTKAMERYYVSNEAKYRAIYTANQMRQETIPVYIYTIGLGTDVSGDGCVEAFLATLANDPNAAGYSGTNCGYLNSGVYNQALPAGEFIPVPDCPGTGNQCAEELNAAFYAIYTKVALRLTQ